MLYLPVKWVGIILPAFQVIHPTTLRVIDSWPEHENDGQSPQGVKPTDVFISILLIKLVS